MNDFIKNPQTRNARAFLPLNISAVGSVEKLVHVFTNYNSKNQIDWSELPVPVRKNHTTNKVWLKFLTMISKIS